MTHTEGHVVFDKGGIDCPFSMRSHGTFCAVALAFSLPAAASMWAGAHRAAEKWLVKLRGKFKLLAEFPHNSVRLANVYQARREALEGR